MKNSVFLAVLDSIVESKFNSFIDEAPSLRGPRGVKGKSGADFCFEDNQGEIESIIDLLIENKKEFLKLKFDDLSDKEKDFLKLRFNDLSDDEISSLRGPKGPRGLTGKPASYEDFKEDLYEKLVDIYNNGKEELKLKFNDLSDEEIDGLRGPKGPRGPSGRAPSYHEFKEDLYEKLVDIYNENKQSLKIKVSDLTQDEKDLLTLKFEHLTDSQVLELRGPKGARGQKGPKGLRGDIGEQGDRGSSGSMGPMGVPGQQGVKGERGLSGIHGRDGFNAPYITEVEIETIDEQMYFVFHFSDGTELETNRVDLPEITRIFSNAVAYSVSGGGGTTLTISKDDVELGEAEILNFEGDNINVAYDPVEKKATVTIDDPVIPDPNCVAIHDEGSEVTDCAKSLNFIGDLVEVISSTMMSDWALLSDVEPSLSAYEVNDPGNVTIKITEPNPANIILKDTVCLSSVYVGAAVRMTSGEVAINALADSTANANVIGVVESKSSPTLCDIRVLGVSIENYIGLDVTKEYYLSDTIAGGLSTSVPIASGHVKLKIGQPFSDKKILMLKGEMTVRA